MASPLNGGPQSGSGSSSKPSLNVLARATAMVSLGCSALVFAVLVVFLARNGIYVVIGLGGAALGVAGGWSVVIGRTWRRVAGWAELAVGATLVIVALLRTSGESWESAIRLAVVLVLLAAVVVCARISLTAHLSVAHRQAGQKVRVPSHPVLLCNPWSGGGKVERYRLAELAASMGVQTIMLDEGLDLAELARTAIADGADCLGMAGGDGSQALVASLAVEHALPFVCVSAGTRNHFALDLGLDRDDPRKSVHAFIDARERHVDYATANGRFFVNNVSLGVYATIVQQEGYREAKVETTRALLPELLGRQEAPFDLQFVTPEGIEVDGAFLIMISNNPYVLGASVDVSQRRRLNAGQLGIFAVSAKTGAQAAQALAMSLAGVAGASGLVHQFGCEEFEVRSRSGRVHAGIDGEALELETPLRCRIHPDGLRMLVPEGNAETALRRQARDVHVKDLISIVRGERHLAAST